MTRHGGLHNTYCTRYDSIGTYDMLQENVSSRVSFIISVCTIPQSIKLYSKIIPKRKSVIGKNSRKWSFSFAWPIFDNPSTHPYFLDRLWRHKWPCCKLFNFFKAKEKLAKLSSLSCSTGGRSSAKPTSVHQLKPGDIDVMGALGDSITVSFLTSISIIIHYCIIIILIGMADFYLLLMSLRSTLHCSATAKAQKSSSNVT